MWRDNESEQDFLNFTDVADQIAALATNPNLLPISIGVFGTWGTGKSTVLRLVETKLAKATPKPIIIKFDAWLYQGYDDAKAVLMEVVAEQLLAEVKGHESLVDKARSFASRINYFRALGIAADVGVGMALGVPPSLLTRAASALGTLVSGNADASIAKDIKDGAAEVADSWARLIKPEQGRTPPKEIAAFRAEFAAILTKLERPLVLFIDNLDRCLPDVAIGTLEAIRLFLFMEGTAFVIAADEDMIRHSVAKYFSDPNAKHVHDYLDKVIQVPMRVPQVGPEDLRAYMYSLFVSVMAPEKLSQVQGCLLSALQDGWKGGNFTRDNIDALAGKPKGLLDALAVCDRLAPILAAAPTINGNPRIVKRILNAITLRQTLAAIRNMNVDLATLAKLAVFERSTDVAATQTLYRLVMEESDADKYIAPATKLKGSRPELPAEWKKHEAFIDQWRDMEPPFENAPALRPALFLSRDVMAPGRNRSGLSDNAQAALTALLAVNSVNSPEAKKIATGLSSLEQAAVMGALVSHLREQDWSQRVKGVHGAIVLAQASPEAAIGFRAFTGALQTKTMDKGTKVILERTEFLSEEE
jgi:predicted KAP-like P-loop ATPase